MTHKHKFTRLSILISGLFIVASPFAHAADQQTTEVGKVTVQGQDGGQNTGLIQAEESPKARSSVNRDYIEKQSATSNAYQMINLLPGVNSYDQDGTGLFGGNIRVRGFNSDQLGFTINGAPVNDSGNFAVYPQEYIDAENLCEVNVTQGSTDTEAPHVGATGGNIGLTICLPEDVRRFRLETIGGSNSLRKYYARVDSGKIFDDKFKFFLSYSKAQVDKFKGEGHADKEHVDFNSRVTLDNSGSYLDTAVMYNKAINNNYRTLTKAQIAQYGTSYDFGTVIPVHQPGVNGTAQNDSTFAPNAGITTGPKNYYYDYNLNPFKNTLATMTGHFQLTPKSAIDVSPYMWFGYGTGGNELQTVTEGNAGTLLGGGAQDVNKDGDTKDVVYAYEGSLTKTYRPGITVKYTQQLDDQRVVFGAWTERARHQQTGPYSAITNGVPVDTWLSNPADYLLNQDGTALQYRNAMTISTGKSLFAQDNLNLLQDKLNVQVGARYSGIDRNFTNLPSQSSPATYTLDKSYSDLLPSLGLRYQLDQADSMFFNVAKNFKAPGNFSYFNLISGGKFVNGVYTGGTMRDVPVNKETSVNYDLGYRYTSDALTFSSTVFYVDYKNRIASAYNQDTQTNTDYNVGSVNSKGFELESGYSITKNLSAYASLSYIKTHMDNDLPFSATAILPTAGKEMPDTPNWLSGLSLQYTEGNWFVFGQGKYTGKRYTTLVNDDSIGGYVSANAGGGYKFESSTWIKNPTLKFNVNNMFDRKYLSLSSGSGSQFTTNAVAVNGIAANAPSFYISPPRTFSLTLVADF